MSSEFIGSVVSIDCGDVLGTYQGQVIGVDKNDNSLTIIKGFRNGVQCQVPKLTIIASDIHELRIIKSNAEANSMPEIRQTPVTISSVAKSEFPEGNVAPARASSADFQKEKQRISPIELPQARQHRSKSTHEVVRSQNGYHQRSSPVKNLYPGNVSRTPKQKGERQNGDYLQHNGYHGKPSHRASPMYSDEDSMDHISRSHDHRQQPPQQNGGSTPRKIENGNRRRQQSRENCFSAPVDTFLGDDFDFEKNLALFDKQAVFKEIENNSNYVVNSGREKPTKYRYDENVLDSGPVVYEQIKVDSSRDTSSGSNSVGGDSTHQAYVTDAGFVVPCISYETRCKLMDTGEKYGLSKARRLEMVGRSASEMVLQLVGGVHRLNPQNAHQRPTVVVLCGPHIQGAQGVNCARHLAVHGVNVTVFVPNFVRVIQELEDEIRLFDLTAETRTSSVKDLPTSSIDIIINAMDNHDNRHLLTGQSWYKSLISWANINRAASLALDPPPEGGAIDTKWSLSLALPLSLSNRCGQVYLCDLGLPKRVFEEIGITYTSPFAHKFVIPLHQKGT